MNARRIPGSQYLPSRLLLGGCLMLLALAPARAQDRPEPTVERVEIRGLSGYRPAQLLPSLKVQAGRPYRAADTSADLKDLSRKMRTAAVRTEPAGEGGVTVIYTVREFPRFRKLQVVGNDKLKTARIEGLARLKEGDVLDENVQRSLLQAIKREYAALGMPQAKVGLNLIDVPAAEGEEAATPRADLQVVIEEGKQILCRDLKIEGNKAFTTARLRLLIDTKGSWGPLKNYYGEETFRDDLAKLRGFYAANGYFDARVERGDFQTGEGKTAWVAPTIRIEEGERYRFGEVQVRGARLFARGEVLEPFAQLKGQPFDAKRFEDALAKLRQLYQDHGLLTTEISPSHAFNAAERTVDTTLEVAEKDRIYVGKVKMVRPSYEVEDEKSWVRNWYDNFAPPVKEETVMHEVLLQPGQVYNKDLERDSMRRLAKLGVFEQDKLTALNEPTGEPGVHNMVIQAEESTTGIIGGGVGYSDYYGAYVFGQFNERNVGGEANVFTLSGMLGTRNSSLVASYLDRHLGDSDDSLLTKGYYLRELRPGYRAQTIGASSEWGHPLSETWTAFLRGRLEGVSLSPRDDHDDTRVDLDRDYLVATVRPRFEQDTRWPLGGMVPRQGYLQSFGVEAGYAGGTLVKLEAARDQYFPLTERLTGRVSAFGGLIPYSRDTVPIHERYFLGGDTDMRGFKYRGAGYFDAEDDDVPVGGAGKLLVKNELHYPIYDPISGVAFVDVGALSEDPVDWQSPRASTGLGLRFDMRNVRVALDFAVPVIKQNDDQPRYFHFSLQSQF